jgi:hypothetical protein
MRALDGLSEESSWDVDLKYESFYLFILTSMLPLVSKSPRIIAPSVIAIGGVQEPRYVLSLPFSVRNGSEYGLAVFPVF